MKQPKVIQTKEFERKLKKLSRHSGLESKVHKMLNDLVANRISNGDQIPGLGGRPVFKIRCGTGNMGKRKGARIIYHKGDSELFALLIYLKNEQENITCEDIMNILEKYELLEPKS